MLRLFVAIALPEDIVEILEDLSGGLPGARWVPPENMHLTLRFIGEVNGQAARDADEALASISMPQFEVQLAGLGQFGSDHKLRSIWVGVQPNPELMRLQAKVETALQRAGLEPERRKFKPHVTLARFKANPGLKLEEYISRNALFKAPAFTVEGFTLFSSYLSGEGAIYRPEADYPLRRDSLMALSAHLRQ